MDFVQIQCSEILRTTLCRSLKRNLGRMAFEINQGLINAGTSGGACQRVGHPSLNLLVVGSIPTRPTTFASP